VLALLLPRRASAAVLLLALAVHLSLLNQAPASAYFAQTLQTWEQGRFIRFMAWASGWAGSGLTRRWRMCWCAPLAPRGPKILSESGMTHFRRAGLLPAPHLLLPERAQERRGLLRPPQRAGGV
jgi:hypothetical protein